MLLKLIACDVFQREACHCIARSPHVIDVEFLELGEHIHSDTLRTLLQGRIDAAAKAKKNYDAILLLYGVCGNSAVGLHARKTPLVIPRAHDCCTILLGARKKFQKYFKDNPSMPFSSSGYMERGDYYLRVEEGDHVIHYGDEYAKYVAQYGEENAQFIWESMHPPLPADFANQVVFIDLPETASLGHAQKFKAKATAEGKTCTRLRGNLVLIRKLIFGQWDQEEFLSVPPGQRTIGVYDWTEILRAGPAAPAKKPVRG